MIMGRKRKLTGYLPVVKFAGGRDTQLKEETEQPQPGGSKAKRKGLQSDKQDSGDASPPKLSPLEKLVQFGLNWNFGPCTDASPPKLSPLEKLVKFDLNWNFGPCTGISRMERWQRAQDLGLMPPQDIKQILLAHSADPQYQHNLWSSYAI